MSARVFDGFALPAGVEPPGAPGRAYAERGIDVGFLDATPAWVAGLARALASAGPDLARRGAGELVASLGRAGSRFLDGADPIRTEAIELLPPTSGLSSQMAAAVLDGMAADWTEERLTRLVRSEFGDPSVLDRFVPIGEGDAMVLGPSLAVQIVAGSVPGVGVNALLRSLLAKGPTLLKPGRGDIVLPVLFARALREVDEALADALAVVYWPGGSVDVEDAALNEAEVVTAYGSDETVRDLRRRTPVTARFVGYHHRVSVGVVGRDALSRSAGHLETVAADVARSVGLFDQRGCVSPQVIYVEEGGASSPLDFAKALGRALQELEERLPGGHLDAPEASALHQARGTAELMGPASGVELLHGGDASWTVLYEGAVGPIVSCVGRVVRVRPMADAGELGQRLRPIGPHLQTVGVAGLGKRLEALARDLGTEGASRVVPFSSVAFPAPWWHHDGRGPLLDLVRWVDLERG